MRKRVRVTVNLQQNKLLLLYAVILLIGIAMGMMAVWWVDGQQSEVAKTALEQAIAESASIDCKQVFVSSAWDHVKPMIWIWLAGFFPFFMPVSGFVVWYKSVFLGFTAGMFLKFYGGRGMLLILSTLMPQYLLFLPVLVLFAYFCGQSFHNRVIYKEGLLKYLLLFVIGLVVCWLCAWLDGYVVAKLLNLVRL